MARADRALTLIDPRTGEPSIRPLLPLGPALCLAAPPTRVRRCGSGLDHVRFLDDEDGRRWQQSIESCQQRLVGAQVAQQQAARGAEAPGDPGRDRRSEDSAEADRAQQAAADARAQADVVQEEDHQPACRTLPVRLVRAEKPQIERR
ncbi:hypothetical protein [Kitasatospora sp. NPDC057015]|uniref:hypothetical protein n=1 Tax=Kitasatospora sp. NPDC057015 TaxID=3346001 RepID=UPI0036419534